MYCSSAMFCYCLLVFFFKQKTAYEMRISDWSSDVCSSDLPSRKARPTLTRQSRIPLEMVQRGPRRLLPPPTRSNRFLSPIKDAFCLLVAAQFKNRALAARFLLHWVHVSICSDERRVGKACVSTCR